MADLQKRYPHVRRQFTLAGLLCLMTVVAFCCGVVAWKGILWGAVAALLAALGFAAWRARRTIASTHPLLWVFTLYAAVSYLLLCIFVNPPFTAIGGYDETKVGTGTMNLIAMALMSWFVGGALLPGVVKNQTIRKWIVMSVGVGLPIGIVLLVGMCCCKAGYATAPGIKRFWLGQAVGTLGIGWLYVFVLLWSLMAKQNSGSADTTPPKNSPRPDDRIGTGESAQAHLDHLHRAD